MFLFFSVGLILLENGVVIQGYAVEESVYSNVTISKAVSIEFSSGLAQGIVFGSVNVLPSINLNGSENYNGSYNSTNYYIQVSGDGNVPVDFCINADSPLSNGVDEIGVENESYSCSNVSNIGLPSLDNETSLTLAPSKCGEVISPGENNYYRFWLDIPAAQPSGNYNNTISFRGILSGEVC